MSPGPRSALLALASAGLAAGALAGCGSQSGTASVAGAPATSAPATSATTPAPPAPASTATTGGTAASTTSTQSSTARTAPEPAFTEGESHAEGADSAAAVVRAHGYTPQDLSEYHPSQTLRVLVGTRTPTGDGYGQQAFFFIDGHFLGTDAKEPSAKLRVVSQSDTEVAIAYPLYRSSDPLCCPGGGQRVVHFALNDGRLTALDPIPPAHSTVEPSRY